MTFTETYKPVVSYRQIMQPAKINYKGEVCNSCSCANCSHRGYCPGGLLGAAKGATKLTVTPQNVGYATAFLNFAKDLNIRTAGGQYIGNNNLIETIKEIALMPVEAAKEVLRYTTTPGIVYEIWQQGKKTKQQIEQRMATDPVFKQKVKNVTEKITSIGKDIIKVVTDPIVSTSKLITWAPYLIALLVGAVVYVAVTQPQNIAPKKVSVF